MRLTHLVARAGCASKLSQGQLKEVLAHLPRSKDANLLVGFEHSDDAGAYKLPTGQVLVQTLDFFTPVVDDPYLYGQIAAANALSDCYAMGATPITAMNIALYDPALVPADVWAKVLLGAYDKCTEAGAAVVGGHTVEDKEPKFGLSVTGIGHPEQLFQNTLAEPGDEIWLTQPIGSGIVLTAAKFDECPPDSFEQAVQNMCRLNKSAMEAGLAAGVRCATDITGYGLGGHLLNVARASQVQIVLDVAAIPRLPHLDDLIEKKNTTGGGMRNREFAASETSGQASENDLHVIFDPQTSGGLALFSKTEIPGAVRIGYVAEGGGLRLA
jgi:selenide, water dikinase